jgi:hypothetical protein
MKPKSTGGKKATHTEQAGEGGSTDNAGVLTASEAGSCHQLPLSSPTGLSRS